MLKSQDELFLNSFSPRELYDHDRLEALKEAAYNLIDSYDLSGAYQFARKLEKIMKELSPQSESEKDSWVVAYFWLVRLKVATFQVSTLPEQLEIFQKFFIFALKNNFDIRQEVTKYLELFSTPKIISETLTSFLNAFTKSPLTLGKLTIENWIIQYHSSLAARRIKGLQPGTFDIVNFLNNSNYARSPDQEEKNLLKSLLVFYNWMGDYASKMQSAAASIQARRPSVPVYMKSERMALPAAPRPVAKSTTTPLTSPLMRGERGGSGPLPPPPPAPPTSFAKATDGQEAAQGPARPQMPPIISRKPTMVPEANSQRSTSLPLASTHRGTLPSSGESNKVGAKQDLYRSVLKELARKHSTPPAPTWVGAPSPRQERGAMYSINESVASGILTKNHGEIVAGQEMEKKLKDLENKVE